MILKLIKKLIRKCNKEIKFFFSVNWFKTIFFNLKMLPFTQAKKLPVFFYGKVKFTGLSGTFEINAPITKGMIGFGQKYELFKVSKKSAQLTLNGKIIIYGHVQFGIDFNVIVNKNALLEMGHLSSLGGSGKIICFNHIKFGNYTRVGYESQVIDTSFHEMLDLKTNTITSLTDPINLGDYNYIGAKVSILKSSKTPKNCTISSNSLLTKDYTVLGENIIIGGVPAKLLRTEIRRNWEGENLEKNLFFKF